MYKSNYIPVIQSSSQSLRMAKISVCAVLVGCLFINAFFTLDQPSYLINIASPISTVYVVNITIGMSLLLFPVFGFIADMCMTRYWMMQASFVIGSMTLLLSLILYYITETISLVVSLDVYIPCQLLSSVTVAAAIPILVIISSIGSFEANAIQFGMDQLLEASSAQLSAFIHCYFWFIHAGQQVVFCVVLVSVSLLSSILSTQLNSTKERLMMFTAIGLLMLIWMTGLLLASYLFHYEKKQMYVAKVGVNPFKRMWDVLSFAWNHKYLVNRSAFTYCEDHAPSRLDLGKKQYGGPFTMEDVEDVKTFLRLLVLLVSLFGYHVAGDGFMVAETMQLYGCPSLAVWGIVVVNPTFVSSMVLLTYIPISRFWQKIHRFTPNMLKRIGIGLLMMVMQDCAYIALTSLPVVHGKSPMYTFNSSFNPYTYCFNSRTNGTLIGSHNPFDPHLPLDKTFLWLIIPQVFNGLGQALLSMTVLEFLCAQAPRSLQGLLIGLWYAMFSIRYLIMRSVDYAITSPDGILIYQVVRTGLVLLSLVVYVYVSRGYQYRVRDWVVNVQWMVEDVFERRMDQEERYIKEQEADGGILFKYSSSSSDESDNLLL